MEQEIFDEMLSDNENNLIVQEQVRGHKAFPLTMGPDPFIEIK